MKARRKTHTDDFKSDLRREVEAICQSEGLEFSKENERGYAFQRWCSDLLSHHEGLDEDDSIDHFTSNDLKVDFIAEDDDEKALYIGQSKMVSLASSPPVDETEVNDFFSRHELFLKGSWVARNASQNLMEYVSDYKYRLDSGWTIHFYFFSTGRASPRTSEIVLEKETIVQKEFQGVKFHLLDISGMKEYQTEAQTLEQSISENVVLQFQRNRAFVMDKPRRTLVGTIKANALANLYRKERERIFTYNIRSFLGRKGINRDIARTASEVPKEFFYYNNGISAICTVLDFDEESATMTAADFQVINGAQTIGSLRQVSNLSSDVEVLIRVTEGDYKTDRGFNANLIKFNNTQNVIKSSDFRSNDTIQRWLETKFNDLRPRGAMTRKFQYVRKRSGKRVANADPLRFEDLAKIRFTWVKEPTQATADPKSLWAYEGEGGHYETAFGISGELEDTWPGTVFEEALLAVLSYRALEGKISAVIRKDRNVLWLRRLRFFALALFRDYIQLKGIAMSMLLGSAAAFKSTIDEFWPHAWMNLVHAHNQAVGQEKTTVFALARSDTRWQHIQSSFRTIIAGLEA